MEGKGLDAMTRRLLRAEVTATVKDAVKSAMEVYEERWLTKEELIRQFGVFSESWLKKYGKMLPRVRVTVEDGGESVVSRWAYPQHRIARMLAGDEVRFVTMDDG